MKEALNTLVHFAKSNSSVFIISGIIFCFAYLLFQMITQTVARRRLEKRVRMDRNKLENKLFKEIENHHSKGDALVTLLRDEIEELEKPLHKEILQKTLNRKNFTNQKQYAARIFQESGIGKALGM